MRSCILRSCVPAAAFLTGFSVRASATPSYARYTHVGDETYSLQRTYKAGETEHYKTVITLESADHTKVDFTLMTTETTKEIHDDGKVVVTATLNSGTARLDGSEKPLPGTPVLFTTTYDRSGNAIKQEGGGVSLEMIGSLLVTSRMNFTLDHPLKIGEEWRYESPGAGDKKSTSVIKLLGLEKKNEEISVDTIKVKSITDSPSTDPKGGQKIHVEAIANIESGTGKPLKTEGTITGLKFGTTDMKITFKRQRVPEEAKH